MGINCFKNAEEEWRNYCNYSSVGYLSKTILGSLVEAKVCLLTAPPSNFLFLSQSKSAVPNHQINLVVEDITSKKLIIPFWEKRQQTDPYPLIMHIPEWQHLTLFGTDVKKIILGKAFSGNLQNRQEPYYIIVNEQWTAYGWDKDKVDIAKIVD